MIRAGVWGCAGRMELHKQESCAMIIRNERRDYIQKGEYYESTL